MNLLNKYKLLVWYPTIGACLLFTTIVLIIINLNNQVLLYEPNRYILGLELGFVFVAAIAYVYFIANEIRGFNNGI